MTQTQEVSLVQKIADARERVLGARWNEADAKEDLTYKRASARQRIIDDLPGYDAAGKPLGVKALGPNETAQQAAIDGLLQQDTSVTDAEEMYRKATRDRERAELTLQCLLDAQSAERWGVRREAVARGVSLGDGAS